MATSFALGKYLTDISIVPSQEIDFQSYFSVSVRDFASYGLKRYAGIHCADGAFRSDKLRATEQITDKSVDYYQKYSSIPHFKKLLTCAINGLSFPEKPVILDLGSGSGNTVFAALDQFPSSSVIAIDPSEESLAILRDFASSKTRYDNRLFLMCQDTYVENIRQGSLDLILGGTILHRLIDPFEAVVQAVGALKPGGHAIFFEPFENGASILRLAVREIFQINEGHQNPLDPTVHKFLKPIDHDYVVRTGTDKRAAIYKKIDDKWLFTRKHFERCAVAAGATDLKIYSIDEPAKQFSSHMKMLLRVGLERDTDALPNWAWKVLSKFDRAFSEDLQKDLFLEACVLIRK